MGAWQRAVREQRRTCSSKGVLVWWLRGIGLFLLALREARTVFPFTVITTNTGRMGTVANKAAVAIVAPLVHSNKERVLATTETMREDSDPRPQLSAIAAGKVRFDRSSRIHQNVAQVYCPGVAALAATRTADTAPVGCDRLQDLIDPPAQEWLIAKSGEAERQSRAAEQPADETEESSDMGLTKM